jgi:hypothetical protein
MSFTDVECICFKISMAQEGHLKVNYFAGAWLAR